MLSSSYIETSFLSRHERYAKLSEMYESMDLSSVRSLNDNKKLAPHKSVPIRKMSITMRKRYDFFHELIYLYQQKDKYEIEEDTEKLGEINSELTNFLQNVFVRALWMINRNIGINEDIQIGSRIYNTRESMYKLFEEIDDFSEEDEEYYSIESFVMTKIYLLNHTIVTHIQRVYHIPIYKPFIDHINNYIKRNLVV